jgi:hypothetical protein
MKRYGTKAADNRGGNVSYAVFIVVFYVLIFYQAEGVFKAVPVINYFDECLAALAFPISIMRLLSGKSRLGILKNSYALTLTAFMLLGLASSLLYDYQSFVVAVLPDMLLCVKFWLLIYVGSRLFGAFHLEHYSKRIAWHVRFVTTVFMGLLIFDIIVSGFFSATIEHGLRGTQLFYSNRTGFMSACMLLLAIMCAVRSTNRVNLIYCLLLTLLLLSTLTSTMFGYVAFFIFFGYIIFIKKRAFKLHSLLLLLPLLLLGAWDDLTYYFINGVGSARSELLVKSIQVANDHFPLGAGFATYGTYYSAVEYSPLYYKYGLSTIWGLSPDRMYNFINDTFWPSILAQFGWLGLVAFFLAVWLLFKRIRELIFNAYYYHSGLLILFGMLVLSFANSSFFHPIGAPLAFWLGILFAQKKGQL